MPEDKPWTYMFFTEDGDVELTYEQYLQEEELVKKVRDARRGFLNLGKVIVSYDRRYLEGDTSKKKEFEGLRDEQLANPIRYYCPCCARTGFRSTGHAFINDTYHELTGVTAGNRFGKTTILYIKQLVTRGLIETQPHWEIHTDHGVMYRPWDGPKIVGFATYQWTNHRTTIWPEIIQKWTPVDMLGDYAKGGKKWPNFQATPQCGLTNDSKIYLHAYDQGQNVFESDPKDGWAWDEQGKEANFDGANLRTATKRWWFEDEDGCERVGAGWHDFGLTPHKLPDRPDTGAGSYIHRIATGEDTKGMSCMFYMGDLMNDVPDWIYNERTKQQMYQDWIETPIAQNNHRRYREGRSRLYGDWHTSSGLVYDDWSRPVHMIDPFPIPKTATRYRGIDHGKKHPFVCLYIAVLSTGDVILYDEYVAAGNLVYENVRNVVAKSGNKLVRKSNSIANGDGSRIAEYREVQSRTRFRQTVMDARSFSRPGDSTRFSLGQTYQIAGLGVSKASGLPNDQAFPIVAEWLRIDPDRIHIQSGERGAPKFYCFNTLKFFPRGIERYSYEEDRTGREKASKKDDDEMDAFKYLMQIPPRYLAGFSSELEGDKGREQPSIQRAVDKLTGY